MTTKDDNSIQVIYGVSHVDGRTPVQIKFDSSGRMLIDPTTTILFNPAVSASQTDNDLPIAKGTSSADDLTVKPWVVNATTGAVLVDSI